MRRDFVQRIRAELPNAAAVAIHPDHPLLLSGPDVLVGIEGLLFAVFVPTAHEANRPNDLLARLVACRLALPSHTHCTVVINDTPLPSEIGRDFDEALEMKDIARLTRTKEKRHSRQSDDLTRVRRETYKRAAVLLKETTELPQKTYTQPTEVLSQFRERTQAEYAVVPSWISTHGWRRSQRILKSGDLIAAAARFTEVRSVKQRLEPIINKGLRLQYSLDNGVPYPKTKSLNAILVDEVPHFRHHPLKPMRCAAFLGWIMLAPDSFADYQRAVEKVERRLRAARPRR